MDVTAKLVPIDVKHACQRLMHNAGTEIRQGGKGYVGVHGPWLLLFPSIILSFLGVSIGTAGNLRQEVGGHCHGVAGAVQ